MWFSSYVLPTVTVEVASGGCELHFVCVCRQGGVEMGDTTGVSLRLDILSPDDSLLLVLIRSLVPANIVFFSVDSGTKSNFSTAGAVG